ncbi:MAG: hypothetical protein JRG83_18130 [Deltaproteobacteria bacterium]|nr:hypothetical protein [Deltaproteobacteria bacterium]
MSNPFGAPNGKRAMSARFLRFSAKPGEGAKPVQALLAAWTLEVGLPEDDDERGCHVRGENPACYQFTGEEVEGHAGRDAGSEPADEEAYPKAPHESHSTDALQDPG